MIPTAVLLHKLIHLLFPRLPSAQSQVSWKVWGIFSLAVFLAGLPMYLQLVGGPDPEIQRAMSHFIFRRGFIAPAKMIQPLAQSLLAHAQTFLGLHGDTYWWAGRPVLDPFLGACLVLGLLISLKRLHQLPYLFVLVYWAGMLAGPVLTFNQTVIHFRMVGALPATYLLIAIAWVELYRWLKKSLAYAFGPRRPAYASGLALAPFLLFTLAWSPFQTYRQYFVAWAGEPLVALHHDAPVLKLIERMERETDPEAIFILRRDDLNPRPNFIIDFLYHGRAPFRYIPVDETILHETLTAELTNYRTVHLVARLEAAREWVQRFADPDDLVPLLLSENGRLINTEETDAFTLLTYRLISNRVVFQPPEPGWNLPPHFKPFSVVAAGLELMAVSQELTDDGLLVGLLCRAQSKVNHHYIVSMQLLDEDGESVTGPDVLPERSLKTLNRNERMIAHYIIPRPVGMKPGKYYLQVGLYYEMAGDQRYYVGAATLNEPVILD